MTMFNELPIHPTLPAKDLDRAKDWYAEKLDLKPVEETSEGLFYETAEDSRFFLYPSQMAGTNEATAAGFAVGDQFDEVVTFLRDKDIDFLEFEMEGVSMENGILTSPEGTRGIWFTDSEGNILAVSDQ